MRFILLANICQVVAIAYLWQRDWFASSGWLFLLLHVIACGLFFYGVRWRSLCDTSVYEHGGYIWGGLFALLPLFFPVVTLGYVVHLYYHNPKHVVESFEEYIRYRPPKELAAVHSSQLWESLQVDPLVDILYEEDKDFCRDAIHKLGRVESAYAVRLLRRALNHRILEIRLYAFYEVDRIEKKLAERLTRAVNLTQRRPDLPESWFELGERYWKYCQSGILDVGSCQQYLQQALASYHKALRILPHEGTFLLAVGKVLVEKKDYRRAKEYLHQAREKLSGNQEVCYWLCQAYFHLREFSQVKNALGQWRELSEKAPLENAEVFDWWRIPVRKEQQL